MSTDKDTKAKTDLKRRFFLGSSLAFAGSAASGVLAGCGGGGSAAGKATTSGNPQVAETPAFAPAAGTYSNAQNVTISTATSGATINYTVDGTMPTSSSPVYGGAIQVSASKTVRAIATASGLEASTVAT